MQFHPEVVHTEYGRQILENFLYKICGFRPEWTMASYLEEAVAQCREKIGNGRVLLALSVGLPLWLDGSFGPLAAAVGYGLAVWYGFRNLDGMSGDISGFALTLGELCGCGAAILWR